jgi:hypothetical protein
VIIIPQLTGFVKRRHVYIKEMHAVF